MMREKVLEFCMREGEIQTSPGLSTSALCALLFFWRKSFVISVSVCHPGSTPLPPQCGFFKRAAKDQYHTAYHKAEIHVQPSDKDKLSAEA